MQRVKAKIGELLVPGNKGAWDEVRVRLNRILRGWSAYFAYGALASAYEAPAASAASTAEEQRSRTRLTLLTAPGRRARTLARLVGPALVAELVDAPG